MGALGKQRGMVDEMVHSWISVIDEVETLDRWQAAIENRVRALGRSPLRQILSSELTLGRQETDPRRILSTPFVRPRWALDGRSMWVESCEWEQRFDNRAYRRALELTVRFHLEEQ